MKKLLRKTTPDATSVTRRNPKRRVRRNPPPTNKGWIA
jgi:hypothetical protein